MLATTSWTVLGESIRPILPTRIVPNHSAFRKRNRLGGTTGPANGAATILAQSTVGTIAAIACSAEGVVSRIEGWLMRRRDTAVSRVSYES